MDVAAARKVARGPHALVDTNMKAIEAQWSSNVPQENKQNGTNFSKYPISINLI